MAYINIANEKQLPGIVGLMSFDQTTAHPLSLLAETLLRGPSTLTSGEREIIASYVSNMDSELILAAITLKIAYVELF